MHAAFEHGVSVKQRKHSHSPEYEFAIPEPALRLLDGGAGGLDEYLSKQVFAACQIPVVEEVLVSSGSEAQKAALELGFPVVMKGLPPGEVHKTELGLVRLGIASPSDAEHCFDYLTRAMNGTGKVLMQKQVPGGLELIAGLVRDPQFGPCVMCGLGGVMAEVLNDVVFAMAPLSRREGLAMIGRLKSQKLLDGFRGSDPLDREALAHILVQLGNIGHAYPRIREIDINPLIVNGGNPVAVDGNVVLDG
jgi:acetyltransferase